MKWTNLPGPASFIAAIEDSLRESNSVHAIVPKCYDKSWLTVIKENLSEIYTVHESPTNLQDFKYSFSGREDCQPIIHAEELHENGIHGCAFILVDPPPELWEEWLKFLLDFAHLNDSYDIHVRSVFLIVTDGLLPDFPNEKLLLEHVFQDYFQREDSLFLASGTAGREETGTLAGRMTIYLRAELALWDFELCERLSAYDLDELLDPFDILIEAAKDRGWIDLADVSESEKRQLGVILESPDRMLKHSCLLAVNRDLQELKSRVWSAQVRFLFPIVEEQRLCIMRKLKNHDEATVLEWEQRFNRERRVLEIGPLAREISSSGKFPSELRDYARKLAKVRNLLAHSEICQPHLLPGNREILD